MPGIDPDCPRADFADTGTVALFAGQLDWGPVIGGYVAALFLAASYTAIGSNISARTDNQIVSLLLSVLVCGLFLLVGSDGLAVLFSSSTGELLKLFGSGARFQSITRGVVDFRDIYYYASITGLFLSLNVLELERLRWSGNPINARHKQWLAIAALSAVNFIAANFWLQQITWARVDLTQGRIYSISPATRKYLARLREPLLIRGYFSKKTHPLLQPLIPRLRDLLKEYAIAANGKIRVEFVDPLEKPELEKEAGEKYGIKPVVLQTANKYQSALTNSYFDILVTYGDQFQRINWKDLIEVKARNEKDVIADLRNPEYDITSAIKRLLYGYQGSGNVFLNMEKPVRFIAYVSPNNRLPEPLIRLKKMLTTTLETLKTQSNGKLSFELSDPDSGSGNLARQLETDYGFKRMTLGLFDPKTFWFYMTMKCGDQVVQVPLPNEIQESALNRGIQAGLKRFSRGFLKTIGIYAPQAPQARLRYRIRSDGFEILKEQLADAYAIKNVSLNDGVVPSDVDLLLMVAPEHINDEQLFAVDQFLMKGGTVMLATAPFDVGIDRTMTCRPVESGLTKWLAHYGIDIPKTMVLDSQNFPLPIPTRRTISGFTVQETQLLPYPYFVDVRGKGLNTRDGIASGITQVIMNWASPVAVDRNVNKQRRVVELLFSSPESWTSSDTAIEPRYDSQQPLGFPAGKDTGRKLLSVAIEGRFQSYFQDKKSPLAEDDAAKNGGAPLQNEPAPGKLDTVPANVIVKSPDSARIVLFASNSFLSDQTMWMASASIGSRYSKSIELVQNAADWSLEDRDLLSIRGRGNFARTLNPMTQGFEMFFEYLNYGLAAAGLLVVWWVRGFWLARRARRFDILTRSTPKPAILEEVRS